MMKIPQYKIVTVLSFLLMLTSIVSIAQVKLESPYSRFGLGDINYGYNVYQSSMGGASYGVIDPYRISTVNPASYAKIDTGSFVFNAAFSGFFVNTKSAGQETTGNYFNLSYLKFATPITGWWRMSGGFMPFSTVGYNLSTYSNVDSVGDIRLGYSGDGGITKVYWGNAFNIYKGLSIGVNSSYMFGSVNISQESEMQDLIYALKYRIKNTVDIRAFYLDFGIQYDAKFGRDKDYFLGLGFVYAPQQNLSATVGSLGYTFDGGGDGYESVKDTIVNIDEGNGDVIIPQKIGGGFSIGKQDKWMFAADVTFDEYSKFKMIDENSFYRNSLRYNVGGRYFIGKIAVNIGANYNNSYLSINGTDIDQFGMSFGIGIPVRNNTRTVSYIDLGLEMGRRGTTANNLIQQDYIKVKLGINIKNTWFSRPKYL